MRFTVTSAGLISNQGKKKKKKKNYFTIINSFDESLKTFHLHGTNALVVTMFTGLHQSKNRGCGRDN